MATAARSSYSVNLHDVLNYQGQVNQLMHGHERPDGGMGVLMPSEFAQLESAFLANETPASFVARVLAARRTRAGVAA